MTDTFGKLSPSAKAVRGLVFLWKLMDRLVDHVFRYIGAFGFVRGPLLCLLSAVWPSTRGKLFRASVPGTDIKVFLRLGSSDISVFNGIFRWEEYRWDLAQQPRTIVDGGAYIGLSAIYFTMRYPGVRVIAVEASAHNFEMLLRNTSAFPNIEPVHAALWSQPGSLVLTDPGSGLWGLQVRQPTAPLSSQLDSAGKQSDSVRAITIEDIIREYDLANIDLLKVDIEGAEKELFSAPGAWLSHVDAICIELHDRFKPGCTRTFFAAVSDFTVEARKGENVLVSREADRRESARVAG